jgi:IcmF-related N-terminal domain
MGLFRRLWDAFRQLIGLVLPIFAKAADFRSMSVGFRRFLHAVVLVVILVILLAVQNYVPGPHNITGRLNRVWLPVLFLVVYGLIWVVWWFVRVWFTQELSNFTDIDDAWNEALRALHDKGIDLQAVPVFLVLGRPEGGEESLFQAAKLPFTVKGIPANPDTPLQVWANKQDGVFITCPDASRLSNRATLLALTARTPTGAVRVDPQPIDVFKSIGADVTPVFGRLMDENLTDEERRRRYDVLERADKPEEARRQTARLEHLCRLIVRDRSPEPPVNGILVLIPFAGTCTDKAADVTGKECRNDLGSAWRVFQLHCPLFALVCDLEIVPGFGAFLDRYLARCTTETEKQVQRKKRLGRGLGWGVGLDSDARQRSVEEQVQWIGQGILPILIYKELLRLEMPGRESMEEVASDNGRLCRFMGAMRDGQKRLTRIVLQGLLSKTGGPELLGGCYLAATGRDATSAQAFVASLFQDRLLASISYVAWSQEALDEDANFHRWTRFGYTALPIFMVVLLLLLFLWCGGMPMLIPR